MYQLAYLDNESRLEDVLRRACDKIAPVWPLENFVAVNPYMGLSGQTYAQAAGELRHVAGARMAMDPGFYLSALERGEMSRADVAWALEQAKSDRDVDDILEATRASTRDKLPSPTVLTVADVASDVTGEDWTRFVTERISAWASSYFDDGIAAWQPERDEHSLYRSWRGEAEHDRTPEIMGLTGFRRVVADLPVSALDAAAEALSRLQLANTGLELYLHRLLLQVGGWSSFAARQAWENRVHHGRQDDTLVQFLAVLLSVEAAILECVVNDELGPAWNAARDSLADIDLLGQTDASLDRALTLHAAYERAGMRQMRKQLDEHSTDRGDRADERPSAQAIFCIDVRSERFRRHLEATDDTIDTLGFAGFFGIPIEYVPLEHERGGAQCPALVLPTHRIYEGVSGAGDEDRVREHRSLSAHVGRAWKAFKKGAVSCFGFVSPLGMAYLPKLLSDSFGLTRPVPHPSLKGLPSRAVEHREPRVAADNESQSGISLDDQVDMARNMLEAMSLTDGFARLVLIAGHGSTNVNNPHASSLDCGACGGRSGEPNARVAAAILNDTRVRRRLADDGIDIPADTVFVAGLHDTTTDDLGVFDLAVPRSHREDLDWLTSRLEEAGRTCRAERARRLHLAPGHTPESNVRARSRDWAQTRPEWGLAGCTSFIVAPRDRTRGLDLNGKSFLHHYRWRQDTEFGVLQQIMTAPMVVASWINLQYYASTVDPELFGAGNKTLHNVVGNIGVLEGNGGDLRVGLPMQSVHDGESFQHDPRRLRVVIEAPIEAMNDVIREHDTVRELLDNEWIWLFAMNQNGHVSHQYQRDLKWTDLSAHDGDRASMLDRAV